MEIRSYSSADCEPLLALFARAGKDSPTGSLWEDPDSEAEIYLHPYIRHDPPRTVGPWTC